MTKASDHSIKMNIMGKNPAQFLLNIENKRVLKKQLWQAVSPGEAKNHKKVTLGFICVQETNTIPSFVLLREVLLSFSYDVLWTVNILGSYLFWITPSLFLIVSFIYFVMSCAQQYLCNTLLNTRENLCNAYHSTKINRLILDLLIYINRLSLYM